MKQNKILISCCVHGDELVGKSIFENYPNGATDYWSYKSFLANPRAIELNTRFLDTDLNRSFPGDKNSPNYEERRASEILRHFSSYNTILDIHQTTAKMSNIAFVRTRTDITDKILKCSQIKIVVVDSKSVEFGGPSSLITDYFNNSVCLEYSKKSSLKEEYGEVQADLENILNNNIQNQELSYYYISATVSKDKNTAGLQNMLPLSLEQKQQLDLDLELDYTPIFIGEQAYKDTFCHLITKLNYDD